MSSRLQVTGIGADPVARPGGPPDPLLAAFELFWHPVCSSDELSHVSGRPLGVRLLGRRIAVARTASGALIALADRCLHRSTRLSVGRVEGETIRCAYHGWRWDADGRCVEIPSMPLGPIPERACIGSYDVEERYGLVWVRLDGRAGTQIPAHAAFDARWSEESDRPEMRIVHGAPYTWPVGAARRVENFVDLAHFAWVHDGSLGRRDEPVPRSRPSSGSMARCGSRSIRRRWTSPTRRSSATPTTACRCP